MWLINTSTLLLEPFYSDDTPAYAILSHTWEDSEVSFQEFAQASENWNVKIASKAGYRKIVATCQQALKDGYCYAWVDTCCIDKTSSTELTEAINSMFGWYRRSQICYVYLSDFMLDMGDFSSQQDQFDAHFRRCRWFTRGWCLQELLAPRHLRFFSQKWLEIGEKSSLSRLISDIAGVPEAVLVMHPKRDIKDFPIAVRISWIAKRQTSRTEDMSYSLLGILDVNMPMLYGEGPKAFIRLQEEIIRKYNDLSIFAWTGDATGSGFMPILAAKPSSFISDPAAHYGSDSRSRLGSRLSTHFSLTNQGVFFPNAKLQYQNAVPQYHHHYLLDLNYRFTPFRGRGGSQRYILLQKIGPGLFIRLHDTAERLRAFQKKPVTTPFYEPVCILHNLSQPLVRQLALWERYAVRLRWKGWEKLGRRFWHIRTAQPRASWDIPANQFLLEIASERYMHIEFVPGNYETNPDLEYFVLVIQVGDDKKRDPAKVSVQIVSAEIWRLNATTFGFRGKEALALEALQSTQSAGDSNRISLVGYDISMSVQLVTEPDEVAYHHVYLDWEATSSRTDTAEAVSSPSSETCRVETARSGKLSPKR
ncbi:heterokaryon incompatibility protein-domain-containing protein [Dactylonectria macrodidyma]|uniref:Heterokaryon incompatibility protein-domain-containing protein n=1 Tax=Dactylonectria macrodidyma TaxID=307937 RepID=A0A9P9JIT8_9HYPO|nr:heterokaryon incompatibility protein-domain-containing protein [Dactylonectria macrodidyma]